MSRSTLLARGLALLPLLTALAACGGGRQRDIVVVTLDTVRADRLGCYGRRQAATPTLDRLAARGVLFEDASCATPITLPSHATLFTGRYPSSTGVRNNGSFVVPASETTLAEVLRAAGWSTAAVIAAFPLQSRFGLAQGFDVYDDTLPPPSAAAGQAFSVHFSERDARKVTDRALEIWGRLSKRPRFLWVHYFDAHAPYEPPEPYRAAHAADPYEGEIAYVDAQLGRLLERIEKDAPDAVVVVAGDHGESLGEHGEKTHGVFLYQSTLHVPLIVRAPGFWPEGKRVPDPVTLADVFPTVLALAGLPARPNLDGGDLGPRARGAGPAPSRPVYAESYLPRLQFRFSPLTMLRGGPLKYVEAPVPELYDLAADPAEARNIAAGAAGPDPRARALAGRLAETTKADAAAESRATVSLDQDAEARLRSLGYASAGTLAGSPGDRGRDPKTMTGYLERYDRAVGRIAAGNFEDGVAELRRLVPEAPENYMARYQLAAGLIVAARYGEARVELDEVVRAAPEFGNGRLMLAECLAELGLLDEAVTRFDEAADLMPTQAEPKLEEGRALDRRGRFEAAGEAYLAALGREPNSMAAATALLALRAGRGDLPRAVKELKDVTRRFPEAAGAWSALADAYSRAGDDPQAIDAASKALSIDPARIQPALLKATSLLRAGRVREAAATFRAVLARDSNSKTAAFGLGRSLVLAGPDSDADAWSERLIAAYPSDAAPFVIRGALLERTGNAAGAVASYREALDRDPRDPEAQRGLDRLGASR